ncbi:class 3 adenylate cyclase [Micromonospora kangleipakensis]|uniref:Class 3 adenylate cyclase n=1 Tax=Micromonospora kangleipakensis TaxID=1077942 RepID=A0A4Q8BGD6_9ACTN|nr:adenylate/guanylate cyclase domain-containing protein [Micromonospora kangleipakensis]RZU76511.1 class 3 adenylate cyclase [Micromonospora kangleipakensis]
MPMSTKVGRRDVVSSTRWPVPEERRTVSVLFADIVGSTGLTERLDPEDVRALQRAYFDSVAGVLRRWNGVVEKYIGDAVMALFGAHASDGFDAYRAVRAGLEIQQAVDRRVPAGTRLRVRVGVATGEVLVDLAATRDGGHGTASGAVITTAARLQEYAPPGAVVVCAATQRATAGLVEQRPLASMTVAGKALPLDVWRVAGTSRSRPTPHHGPLVGRRRELAAAGDEIARAVRDRRPRWISLAGPAGSGRSRLLHELTRAVSTVDGAPVRWCVAHCPPYAEGGLAPLADMVRGFAGVRDTDLPPTVRRRLATALDGLLPPARLGHAAHTLAELLAAPEDAGAAGRGADVWRQILLELAARQPVVVAVDDLDRAAPAMNRFLHRLFAAATERSLPLAVVATHGTGWADVLPGAGDRRRRVPLPPLGTVDTGRLLRHLLGRAGRPAALARDLLPLVGGNPAVAEAYVRALDEDGGGAPAGRVPDPVRRIVDARLDRLDGDHRAVLMAGAELGARFAAGTIERLLGWVPGRAEPVLRELVAGGLLRRPARGGYTVAEPAVARVARHRLPRAVRAEFARRAGAPLAAACTVGAGSRPDRVPGTARPNAVPDTARPAGVPDTARPVGGVWQRRHSAEVAPRRTALAGAGSRSAPRDRSGSGSVTPSWSGPDRAGADPAGAAGGHAGFAPPVPVRRPRWGSSTPDPVRAPGGGTPPGLATVGPPAPPTTARRGSVVPLAGSPRSTPPGSRPRPVAPLGKAAPAAPAGSPVRLADATVRRRRTGPTAAGPIPLAAA